jgi:F1F0 ATPase subunit 2
MTIKKRINMSDMSSVMLALPAGALLGTVFFGGLWWTILRAVSSGKPALWFPVSLFVRTGIVVTGLYYISHGSWRALLASLAGFLAARFAVTRFTRVPGRLEEGAP